MFFGIRTVKLMRWLVRLLLHALPTSSCWTVLGLLFGICLTLSWREALTVELRRILDLLGAASGSEHVAVLSLGFFFEGEFGLVRRQTMRQNFPVCTYCYAS